MYRITLQHYMKTQKRLLTSCVPSLI